jgi:hypothetical protein
MNRSRARLLAGAAVLASFVAVVGMAGDNRKATSD